jgi:CP family cyanate transporter-like MFS transporter
MASSLARRDRSGTAAIPGRLLLLAIVLVAVNLRAALAELPPLVHTIQTDLGLSGAGAGLLTTLPVLCMGVFAPLSQRLARVIGREATVGVALVLLLVGLLMRLAGSVFPLLLASTVLVGIGIALCGTVLPGIVKEFFAHRPGLVTGVYLLAMMVGATAASALAVPLSHALGSWERSLAAWSTLVVLGLLAWLPVVRTANNRDEPDEPSPETALPWRSPTAWLLAGYLAMQSFGFYSQLAWIPPSYEDRGWTARDAGLLLAVWTIVQLFSGLGVPVLADRLTDHRPLVAASVSCGLLGIVGVLVAPDTATVLWIALMGLGQGGGFALGLVKLVDYAPSPAASARLSALVFLVSYSTASLGPLVFGAVHDLTDGFTMPYALLAVVLLAQLVLVPRLRPGRLTEGADRPAHDAATSGEVRSIP